MGKLHGCDQWQGFRSVLHWISVDQGICWLNCAMKQCLGMVLNKQRKQTIKMKAEENIPETAFFPWSAVPAFIKWHIPSPCAVLQFEKKNVLN